MVLWLSLVSVIVVPTASVTRALDLQLSVAAPVDRGALSVPPVMVSLTSSTVPPSSALMTLLVGLTLVTSLLISSVAPLFASSVAPASLVMALTAPVPVLRISSLVASAVAAMLPKLSSVRLAPMLPMPLMLP